MKSSYQFVFLPTRFSCVLRAEQCKYLTQKNIRCRNRTVFGLGICRVHLKLAGLSIKPSPGKGLGLYAAQTFKPNQLILIYHGEYIDKTMLDHRYGNDEYTAPYVFEIKKDLFVDAACSRYPASFINHSDTAPNVYAAVVIKKKYIEIRALRTIRHGQELLMDYSDGIEESLYEFQENFKIRRTPP